MANEPISNAAGPGAIQESGIAPKPALESATEYEYVELLNPLSVDFYGKFGVERPITAPIRISAGNPNAPAVTQTEADLRTNYGLDLRNPNHQGKARITNTVLIKSGHTVRLLGNEAQVVCTQLVNEIMQREGKKLLLSDAHARSLVEQRIIISRGTVAELMQGRPVSVHEQLQQAVNEDTPSEEQEFPGVTEAGSGSGDSGSAAEPRQRRANGTFVKKTAA